jgi:hypothetical protein
MDSSLIFHITWSTLNKNQVQNTVKRYSHSPQELYIEYEWLNKCKVPLLYLVQHKSVSKRIWFIFVFTVDLIKEFSLSLHTWCYVWIHLILFHMGEIHIFVNVLPIFEMISLWVISDGSL